MRQVLHLLTRPDDPVATDLVARQRQEPELRVTVIDLTQPDPDYDAVWAAVWAADTVMVW